VSGSCLRPRAAGTTSGVSDDEGFIPYLGVQDMQAEDGRASLSLEAGDRHLNPAGAVHGGVLASMVDMAMGHAVRSSTGESDVPTTSQLTLTYLRPGTPGRITVHAAVSKQGDHLTVCQADVEQDGKGLVHALATFAVLHR
jgi:uncharacterized protein (TIGR00369 family)